MSAIRHAAEKPIQGERFCSPVASPLYSAAMAIGHDYRFIDGPIASDNKDGPHVIGYLQRISCHACEPWLSPRRTRPHDLVSDHQDSDLLCSATCRSNWKDHHGYHAQHAEIVTPTEL